MEQTDRLFYGWKIKEREIERTPLQRVYLCSVIYVDRTRRDVFAVHYAVLYMCTTSCSSYYRDVRFVAAIIIGLCATFSRL